MKDDVKIKEFMYQLMEMGQKRYDSYTKRVQNELDFKARQYRDSLTARIKDCESPIEQIFYIHFIDSVNDMNNSVESMDIHSRCAFTPQKEVEVNGKNYRLDFAYELTVNDVDYKFAIECDGHEFHEKTKEQARRDRQRERDLQTVGYTVIRFTGSEIWEDPFSCVVQAERLIDSQIGIQEYWEKRAADDMENGRI